ncbi:hypothetical protein CERSUDRAFT_111103 [Gelatoporia subvermispora B]|uniref:Uncharacterized protein n=1 Tax=Ceriporiopsis subvermispora (strain B) TaxID=914234 RepID=M2RNT9_CERS8|nr:hypothetical protein CERSUDRAFT_111103 [Gelatoporia subvermispora B]
MLGALYRLPNHVPARQRLVQSSHEPVYYRLPRGKLYVRSYLVLFGFSMLATAYGAYDLVKGKPAAA